jgi:hypothetical protein
MLATLTYYSRIYQTLKPDGWIDIQEYNSYFYSDDDPKKEKFLNTAKWTKLCNEANEKFGKSLNIALKQKKYLVKVGFHDIQDNVYKVC